jgi:hypothetical protein
MQRSSELFQPIQAQQVSSSRQPSARERLFGNAANCSSSQNYGSGNYQHQQQISGSSNSQNYQQMNELNEFGGSRKIAMVKPELRTSEK